MIINSFWIKGELNPINLLTIKSFQNFGHEFVIYSYIPLPNAGCEVKDANDILNYDHFFEYNNFEEEFKLGGFSELFKSHLLFKVGGWYVDMDVICLKEFDFTSEYVFRPHKLGIVANIIRVPLESSFAKDFCYQTSKIDVNSEDYEHSFANLITIVKKYNLDRYIVSGRAFGLDEDRYLFPAIQNIGFIPDSDVYAIHLQAALRHTKNYEKGSFLDTQLKKYGL